MKTLYRSIQEGIFGKASNILSREELVRIWLEENCEFEAGWGKDPNPRLHRVGSDWVVDAETVVFRHKTDTLNGNGLFRWGKVVLFNASELADLTTTAGIPETVELLSLWNNRNIRRLEGFSRKTKIKQLDLAGCTGLTNLKGLAGEVEILRFSDTNIKSFEGIPPVKQLNACSCYKLESLKGVPPWIYQLNLRYCDKLETLDGLVQCKHLLLESNTSLQSIGSTLEHVAELEIFPGVPPKMRHELRKLEKAGKIDIIRIRR